MNRKYAETLCIFFFYSILGEERKEKGGEERGRRVGREEE